jgi:hypothetical protein
MHLDMTYMFRSINLEKMKTICNLKQLERFRNTLTEPTINLTARPLGGRMTYQFHATLSLLLKRMKVTLQGFPPIATNPLGNTTISVAIGGYYCTETVIWLQFVCLLQHKI